MILPRAWRRRAQALIAPALGIALSGYFAYHLVGGDRGLLAWVRLRHEITAENDKLAGQRAARAALDLKVKNLRPDHLDPDLLDERVRATLNLASSGEIVIMPPPRSAPIPTARRPAPLPEAE
jgi:cell division protein FtsB